MIPYTEKDLLGGHEPYSTSKACAEFVIESYNECFFGNSGVSVASARAGNVIGGGDWAKDRIITDIVRAIFEKKEPIKIRSPNYIRPWQHVLDPLFGYILLAKKLYEKNSEFVGAWNFAPDKSSFITVLDLVKRANKICGGSYDITQADKSKPEMKLLTLDASKARKYLGFTPLVKIDDALKLTFEWYKSFYDGAEMSNLTNSQINYYLSRLKWK
jgi:CDP-glucose 4,6-dehydratase